MRSARAVWACGMWVAARLSVTEVRDEIRERGPRPTNRVLPKVMVAVNRQRAPYALWGLIGMVVTFGTGSWGRKNLFFFIQIGLALTAAAWLWRRTKALLWPVSTAKAAKASAAAREPGTKNELKAWLFRHTHEQLPSSDQPLQFYRDLYLKHKDRVATHAKATPSERAQASRAYVDGRGAIFHAPPLPSLSGTTLLTMVLASCTLGSLAAAVGTGCVPVPPRLPAVFLSPMMPGFALRIMYALNHLFSMSPLWLSRALGVALASACVNRAARPHARCSLSTVSLWAMFASGCAEMYLPSLWFHMVGPVLMKVLGVVGELLVLSPITYPAMHLLLPALAAAAALARYSRPSASASNQRSSSMASRCRRVSAVTAPVVLLLLLHASLFATHIAIHPGRRAHAAAIHDQVRRGEWRVLLADARAAIWAAIKWAPPPPPPGAPPSRDDEAQACAALGVSVGSSWSTVKQAFRALAIEHHPDKLRGKLGREPSEEEVDAAAARFNKVREAHDVLDRIHSLRSEDANLREEL